jgi:predicted ATPase
MLKRIYINNFRCLVNFDLSFDSINLFLGNNGSGKTSVFTVLRKIQALICDNEKLDKIFNPADCTRWQKLLTQQFELELSTAAGRYKYELEVEYDRNKLQPSIRRERLSLDTNLLLVSESGEIKLYDDEYSLMQEYSLNTAQSVFSSLRLSQNNQKLIEFRDGIDRIIIAQVMPQSIAADTYSYQNSKRLCPNLDNFVGWYDRVSDNQGKVIQLTHAIQEILEGFEYFKFTQISTINRVLEVSVGGEIYKFDELSDGQKTLIVLYTLLYFTQSENYTLCLDEPENFLALPEIQPWLMQVYESCSENKLQALLISHHPELIDILAASTGYWFDRNGSVPVRVRRIGEQENAESGLKVSELIARGWLSDCSHLVFFVKSSKSEHPKTRVTRHSTVKPSR